MSRLVARVCRSELIVSDDMGMLLAGEGTAEAFYRVVDAALRYRGVVPNHQWLLTRTAAINLRRQIRLGHDLCG